MIAKKPKPLEALLFNLKTSDKSMSDHSTQCTNCINDNPCEEWTGMTASHNLYYLALAVYEKEEYGTQTITDI